MPAANFSSSSTVESSVVRKTERRGFGESSSENMLGKIPLVMGISPQDAIHFNENLNLRICIRWTVKRECRNRKREVGSFLESYPLKVGIFPIKILFEIYLKCCEF